MHSNETKPYKMAVTCFIHDAEGKFLLLNVPGFFLGAGKWSVPGAVLETPNLFSATPGNELGSIAYSPLELTVKQKMKEYGLEIGSPRYFLNTAWLTALDFPMIVINFHAPYVAGEVATEKGTQARWVTLAEANVLPTISGLVDRMDMVHGILTKKI